MWLEIQYGLPVFLISVFSVLIILIDAISGKNKQIVFVSSIIALLATAGAAGYTLMLDYTVFNFTSPDYLPITSGALSFGGFSAAFDILFALAGVMTIVSSRYYLRREFKDYDEYYSLMIFAINGMILISHANSMLMMFIGIEMMSISFYVLAGFIRNKINAVEASLKYFLLGSFATGFLIYGMAMIYGATGSIDFETIRYSVENGLVQNTYFTIGLALFMIGLAFKISAVPFHQWAPDVYTGAPTVVTAFMSTAGKAAAFAAFLIFAQNLINVQFASSAVGDAIDSVKSTVSSARNVLAWIAALTMLLGNITALVQPNVKRMLAYSSVAHAGYILMGIVGGNQIGYSGVLFYSAAYMFMQIGAFIVVSVIERDLDKNMNISDYAGLHKKNPFTAALMAIFMFSLAGLPPFAGFPGKYMLFISTVEAGYTWLTIVAVVATIISMYFYIGLVLQMYFKDIEANIPEADTRGSAFTLALATVGVLALGIFPQFLIDFAKTLF